MTIKLMSKSLVISILLVLSTAAQSLESSHRVLLFFYSSDCEYCHQMADILVNLRNKHGVKIVANSLDGKKIPQFPNALYDKTITRKFKVISLPTLVAVDINAKQFEVISIGLELETILEAKVLAWMNNA